MPLLDTINNAKHVVEELLEMKEFISGYQTRIYNKLESLDSTSTGQLGGDVTFIAESIALLNGIVMIGSTLQNYDNATNWVKNQLKRSDPAPVLAALSFIYVVENAFKEYQNSPDTYKKETWTRIHNRIKGLLDN